MCHALQWSGFASPFFAGILRIIWLEATKYWASQLSQKSQVKQFQSLINPEIGILDEEIIT